MRILSLAVALALALAGAARAAPTAADQAAISAVETHLKPVTVGAAGGVLANEIMQALETAYGWGKPDPATRGSLRRAPDFPPAAK
ncbi:MAG TPA: hypothetical protein VIE16_10100 [Phenylobacterium sp.]|jgi:hypothetical protein